MDKETLINIARDAGFIYHKEYVYASYAPGSRSIRQEGFKYGLEEIPFESIQKMLIAAQNVQAHESIDGHTVVCTPKGGRAYMDVRIQCSICPYVTALKYRAANRFEDLYEYKCGASNYRHIGLHEYNDSSIAIPEWCPLRDRQSENTGN